MLETTQRTRMKISRTATTPCYYTLGIFPSSNVILPSPVAKGAYSNTPTAPTTAAAKPASGTYLIAAPLDLVAGALVSVEDSVADAEVEAAALLVEAAPAPGLTELGSRLPHWLLHEEEPGLAVLHCLKVAWHSRKGRVCEYWLRLGGV